MLTKQLSGFLLTIIAAGVSLSACAALPREPDYSATPELSSVSDVVVVLTSDGGVNTLAFKERPGFGFEAVVSGTLVRDANQCLALRSSDGVLEYPLWPAGTKFDDESIEIPSLGTILEGDEFTGSGGHFSADDLELGALPCAGGEIVIISE